MFLTKVKLKRTLITDYMKVCEAESFCDNSSLSTINNRVRLINLKKLCKSLKNCYEQIFLKIGLVDLAFFLLKKELLLTKHERNYSGADEEALLKKVGDYEKEMQILKLSVQNKMKKLYFNDFEINLIKNFSENHG